jgi:hypothetical protein
MNYSSRKSNIQEYWKLIPMNYEMVYRYLKSDNQSKNVTVQKKPLKTLT